MSKFYPNGPGGVLGSITAQAKPLYMSSQVYYVNSATGQDNLTHGLDRLYPAATLSYVLDDEVGLGAPDDSLIVLMDGHQETFVGSQLAHRYNIVGEGLSGGKPTAKLTLGDASANMFTVMNRVRFENIWFKPRVEGPATGFYFENGADADFSAYEGCYFECNENTDGGGVSVLDTCNGIRFYGCTWVSTSQLTNNRPFPGIIATGSILSLELHDCVLDGGTYGWRLPAAIDATDATILGLRIRNVSMLRGADISLSSDCTGTVSVYESTGSSRVVW